MAETTITPYLFFGGRCEEALEFYRKALGAEVEMIMRYDECPAPPPPGMLPPGFEKKVMHSAFRVRGVPLMASDGTHEVPNHDGMRLALSVPAEEDARRAFEALADGGKVDMPIGRTFFSPCFGTVTDRFGVRWMVTVPQAPSS